MKKAIPILLLIIWVGLSFLFKGCSLITTYRDFGVTYDSAHNPQGTEPYYYVSVGFTHTTKVTPIIPLIYDWETYKDPYTYHFTIQGELAEINSIKASFILNGESHELIPIDAQWLNEKKKKDRNKAYYYFPAGGIDMPFSWDQIEGLEMDIHFTATDLEGKTIEHNEKIQFKKYLQKETGNRIINHAISI